MVGTMSVVRSRAVRLALALLAIGLVLLVWWWASTSSTAPAGEQTGARASSSSTSLTSTSGSSTSGSSTSLPSVQVAELPPEARRTLDLIAAGGPYPYPRDGVAFQNREQLLPRKAGGYYREYTVPTPGEADRGARRIITGRAGEYYWTDDHYASFSVIEGGAR